MAGTRLSQLGKFRFVKVTVVGSVENDGVAEWFVDSFLWGACEALQDRYLFSGFEVYM